MPRNLEPGRARAHHYLFAALVVAAVCTIFMVRIHRQPIQPAGGDSVYTEHRDRLHVLEALRRADLSQPRLLVRSLDNAYPPGLHVFTAALGALSGHWVDDVVWTGLVWLALLALGVGGCAAALTGSRLAGLAAFGATMLLPAGQAAATRYYYDLPMSAWLWIMLWGARARWERRPGRGGVGAGALLAMACLTKWTAASFGVMFLCCAAVTPAARQVYRLPRRALALGICLATGACLAGLFLYSVGGIN